MSARRVLLATVLPAALLAGPVAGSASADTATPDVISGAPGTVNFAASGSTPITKIEVDLPISTPMRDVTVPAMPGWSASTTSAALPSCGDQAVSSVTWTATGAPQLTGSFALQVGAFPTTDQMDFTGTITYADGRAVTWTQPEAIGADRAALPSLGATPAVTVTARSTAPQPTALQPTVLTPTGNWMTTFVRMVMSVW